MSGLTRSTPLALGLAAVVFVVGVVAGPVLGVGDSSDDDSNDPNEAAAGTTTTAAPTTTAVPVTLPPVEDLGTTLVDFSPWGFAPVAGAGSPFDGPMDIAEAAAFADADVAAEQQRLTENGWTRGHAALWNTPEGGVAAAGVHEFATVEGARADYDQRRSTNMSVSLNFATIETVDDGFSIWVTEDDLAGLEAVVLIGNRVHRLVVLRPGIFHDVDEFAAIVAAQAALVG